MIKHKISQKDQEYFESFKAFKIKPEAFHHREHIRIAYILLAELSVEQAFITLKDDLLSFLDFIGAGKSKYHETMTYAWLLAVNHFMNKCSPCSSSDEFIDSNKILLDKDIMYTHYSRELIESDNARMIFVQPDLELIP
ncbi:MAG: hypothetical protein GWO07_03825, partial [Candidatus Dadabacteria bacterium]|nr:hypothetical protein [Candidatus Dadabacteria bacterium]NIV42918.1 hypothetical protein [Candidatus Dadabacteria bacterium]NIX14882.1 hypothetical protein [Candidatus Dadabacteria bacterium]